MELLKRAVLPAAAGWLAIDLYMSVADGARDIAPLRLFQWDASNVLGSAAYAGGWSAAALGFVLDYGVSFVWAVIAVYALGRFELWGKHTFVFGLLYGAVVMFVMLWIVVPLGLARQGAMTWTNFAIVLVGHTLFFGVPLAVVASRCSRWPRYLGRPSIPQDDTGA